MRCLVGVKRWAWHLRMLLRTVLQVRCGVLSFDVSVMSCSMPGSLRRCCCIGIAPSQAY